jgi:hypothetical protein
VRDGIDGYCIPTLMPGADSCTDLALRHVLDMDPYDVYCGWRVRWSPSISKRRRTRFPA